METSLLNHFFMQSWGVCRWLILPSGGSNRIVGKATLLVSEPVMEGLRGQKERKATEHFNSPKVEQ